MAPKKANAIPAFAQKYHFSCAVCHTVFPNLNPFGRAFWRNGFRLPGTNGTPADATQITEGLSLPNPWPVPIMVGANIWYNHTTNENISPNTDAFGVKINIVSGGAYKLYNPLTNSLSFYFHLAAKNGGHFGTSVWASLNGLGSGLGLAPHLINLKLGQIMTASPYFYRQEVLFPGGLASLGQNLNVGYDSEAGLLIHSQNAGFELYGTPGYHLWYKVTVTNDAGSGPLTASAVSASQSGISPYTYTPASAATHGTSNAMEYSYQLKEYAPIPMGQLEFGYYGSTIAEPIGDGSGSVWTNRVQVNGIDADIANDVYELGATYMVQSDSNPYGNPSAASVNITLDGNTVGNNHSSNGYSTFEVYGRYILPVMNNGVMLSADYAQYSWTHKDLQEGAIGNSSPCDNADLYENGTYKNQSNSCTNEGIQDALELQASINLSLNSHLYVGYQFTNESQDNTLQTGLFFAF
jgi:hypothetical protein